MVVYVRVESLQAAIAASEAVFSARGPERRVSKELGCSNVAAQDRKMQGTNEVVEIVDEDSAEQLRYSFGILSFMCHSDRCVPE